MKKGLKLTSLLLVLVMLASFALTSCGTLGGISSMIGLFGTLQGVIEEENGFFEEIPDDEIEEGNKETIDTSGVLDSMDTSYGDGGKITDVTLAAASGLRSAVSVYATFSSGFSSGSAAGSGVIYQLDAEKGNAFIITNYHVIYNGSSYTQNGTISNDIKIFLFGMESTDYAIPATFVGGSPNYDIAILFIQNSDILKQAAANGNVKAATISNSDSIVAGQTAIAIGNPESSGIAVTSGVVSVDSEYIQMTSINGTDTVEFRVIRIDTAVNSGNSGGGLFNDEGELMGIVNAKITKSDVENIGYAIPSNVARAIADNIIDYCFGKDTQNVMRAMLGVTVTVGELSSRYDEEKGIITQVEKVVVVETTEGGLAYGVLETDDVIKSITIGEKTVQVTRRHHLIDTMLDARIGDKVTFKIIRDGAEKTVEFTITEDCLTAY